MPIKRTILKQVLVKKLYPDSISVNSAMEQLRCEINQCPELKQKIIAAGNHRRHYYNRQQLDLVLEHFCLTLDDLDQL